MNGAAGRGARLMNSSITGMSPWILFSLLAGPGRYGLAAALALAVAVLLVLVRHRQIFLEVAGLVFFAVLTVIGMIVTADTLRWLDTYAGELSNLSIAALALVSVAVRAPLTVPYARKKVARAFWHTRDFQRTNVIITYAWGLAFLAAAVAGGVGDLVLHNPDNLWTGWIIQVSALVTAARFTEWYPAVVRARLDPTEPVPPVRSLLMPFVGLLIPMGVLVLLLDAAPRWFAVALMVVGVVLARALTTEAVVARGEGREP
ncbi:hypothetical protein QWM81_16665 [Streptomyces ficellus]|uniref:Uncharacterized protein n=1 Tax=Streptomyces ficellus TaxID=1977088 RepID=A0ABT7Z830_9ACTN|nr:hypothetical protein [Streptomyces ficellus]MDN3295655.1 hypothetical protein [Streptomyces ficellus]